MSQHEPAQSDSEYAITENVLKYKDNSFENINKFYLTSDIPVLNMQLNQIQKQKQKQIPSWKIINTQLPIPLYSFSIFKFKGMYHIFGGKSKSNPLPSNRQINLSPEQ